jgi:hypothetical protein
MAKFFKTPDQIAALMQHWFLSYYREGIDFFSGSETFTFFDLVHDDLRLRLLQRVNLEENEKPVFLLNCDNDVFVLNTTHRFIRVGERDIESVFYTDFDWHVGYKSIAITINGKLKGVKSDGYFAEFGLRKHDGEIVYWLIPAGRPGFAFWNVTKRCDLIGRKYL